MPLLNQQYRHLTLRHEQRLLGNKPPTLAPGYAQFSSYYLPSLNAGEHTINVSQTVTATLPDDRKGDPSLIDKDHPEPRQRKTVNIPRQHFTVLAPQYSLPEEAVVSVFPTSSHTAQPLTLPHIVLKDSHCPWERNVVDSDGHDKDSLNSIPWFALVVFTAEELALNGNERSNYLGIEAKQEPTETLGFSINVKDAIADGKIPRPSGRGVFIAKPDDEGMAKRSSDILNLVAFPANLFHKLFVRASKDKNDNHITQGDIEMFRFLSHVRTVATDGMSSTAETGGEPGTFALTISPRIGPQTITTPTTLYVHLLSLEGVHGCTPPHLDAEGKARVVMTSLYSWSYTSLPPDTFSVVNTLQNLGEGLSVLHTDRRGSKETDKTQIERIITRRQEEGFTLTRYRTITGEETAAILRGPLVPVKVPHPLQNGMTFQTNFGTDLNILDPDLGLMDLSYSTAWQLGRTLALGDPTFTTSLARLRGALFKEALSKSKQGVHMALGAYAGTRGTVLSEAVRAVSRLQEMNEGLAPSSSSPVSTNRWRRGEPQVLQVDTKLHSEHIFYQMSAQANEVAHIHSRALNSDAPVSYHTIPTNPDYFTVQSWILDKLHLAGIPAHYLITDPSHVPPESLRFFHIDENWTEALIDGALSLANQSTSLASEDCVRAAIKKQLQDYMDKPLEGLGYCQQMPKYGFIMRSEILVQFPDLAVSAQFAKVFKPNGEDLDKVKPQTPILVQRRLASDMGLVLFDRAPPNLTALEFALPPHQQTFVIGSGLDETNLHISHLKIYATKPDDNPRLEPPSDADERRMPLKPAPRPWKASDFLDIESGVMNVEHYACTVHRVLKGEMKKDMYTEQGPTSAVFALQLNEPIHTLRIAITSQWEMTSFKDRYFPAKGAFHFHIPKFPDEKYAPKSQLEPYEANNTTIKPFMQLPERQVNPDSVSRLIGPFGPAFEGSHPDTGTMADKPDFIFGIYPFEYDGFVPTNRCTPVDLIVKLVLRYNFDLTLLRLDVIIDLGTNVEEKDPPDEAQKPRPLAADISQTDAPRPTMLSNLHFDVVRRFEDQAIDGAASEDGSPQKADTANTTTKPKRVMRLSVIPRSSKGVNLKTLEDASFLLPLVNVLKWKPPHGTKYVSNVQLQVKWEGRWIGTKPPPEDKRPIFSHTFIHKVYMAEEEKKDIGIK